MSDVNSVVSSYQSNGGSNNSSNNSFNLSSLPLEILHLILLFLDVPDLLSISRVSHQFRSLAIDPHLHHLRLLSASSHLAVYLPNRPSISSLRPPTSSILLSRTHIVARAISRSLISIRLARNLSSRPPPEVLIDRHILPAECVGYFGPVAPGIIQSQDELRKRKLRERLRGRLERRMSFEGMIERGILPGELLWTKHGHGHGHGHGHKNINTSSGTGYTGTGQAGSGHVSAGLAGLASTGSGIGPDTGSPGTPFGGMGIQDGDTKRFSTGSRMDSSTHPSYGQYDHACIPVAPGLIEARRKVIKERLKDGLRAWIEKRARLIQRRARREAGEDDGDDDDQIMSKPGLPVYPFEDNHHRRASVKLLIRRFTRSIQLQQQQQQQLRPLSSSSTAASSTSSSTKIPCGCDTHARQRRLRGGGGSGVGNTSFRRWEPPAPPPSYHHRQQNNTGSCTQPTRAHVLGLRRFWEEVIRGSA